MINEEMGLQREAHINYKVDFVIIGLKDAAALRRADR